MDNWSQNRVRIWMVGGFVVACGLLLMQGPVPGRLIVVRSSSPRVQEPQAVRPVDVAQPKEPAAVVSSLSSQVGDSAMSATRPVPWESDRFILWEDPTPMSGLASPSASGWATSQPQRSALVEQAEDIRQWYSEWEPSGAVTLDPVVIIGRPAGD